MVSRVLRIQLWDIGLGVEVKVSLDIIGHLVLSWAYKPAYLSVHIGLS